MTFDYICDSSDGCCLIDHCAGKNATPLDNGLRLAWVSERDGQHVLRVGGAVRLANENKQDKECSPHECTPGPFADHYTYRVAKKVSIIKAYSNRH